MEEDLKSGLIMIEEESGLQLEQQKDLELENVDDVVHPVAEDGEGSLRSILLQMPLRRLVRLRTVNKQWKSLLESPSFLKEWDRQQNSNRRSWVVMERKTAAGSGRSQLVAYDHVAGWWTELDGVIRRCMWWTLCRSWWLEPAAVQGSSGGIPGLLCFVVWENILVQFNRVSREFRPSILVLNPLTGFHALVKFGSIPYFLRGVLGFSIRLIPDQNHHHTSQEEAAGRRQHFRILLVRLDLDQIHVRSHIYHSRNQSWKSTVLDVSALPLLPSASCLQDADHIHAFFCCLRPSPNHFRILAFSSKLECWVTALLPAIHPRPERHLNSAFDSYHVFTHRGRLYLAVALLHHQDLAPPSEQYSNLVAGFAVHVASSSSISYGSDDHWMEIACTPPHLRQRVDALCGHNHDSRAFLFDFVFAGDLLYMTVTDKASPMNFLGSLAYNMENHSWDSPPTSQHERVRALCSMRPSVTNVYASLRRPPV